MNKREFVRQFLSTSIQLYDAEDSLLCGVKVNDMSQGGVLVVSYGTETFEGFEAGQEVKFIMEITTGMVAGTAEVVWVDTGESKMGLKFTKILNRDGVANLMDFFLS